MFIPLELHRLMPSGLEKDWIVSWHSLLAKRFGLNLMVRDICRNDPLPKPDDLTAVIPGDTIHLILEDSPSINVLPRWLRAYLPGIMKTIQHPKITKIFNKNKFPENIS